ncbi:MAG: hypothetical protein ACRBBN_04985 [Methyloligellaceae bacterium]
MSTIDKAIVIKAVDVPAFMQSVDIIEKAKLRADSIEKNAIQKAQQILTSARNSAEEIEEKAKEETRQLCQNIEKEERKRINTELAEEVIRTTENLQKQLNQLDLHLITLVKKSLEIIIGETNDIERIEQVIKQGLLHLKEQLGLTLLVSAEEFSHARKAISQLPALVPDHPGPIQKIEIDTELKAGEYYLVSSGGLLNISIPTQIDQITQSLKIMRNKGNP